MEKSNVTQEPAKDISKASIWIELALWQQFQKKAKNEKTNGSLKLVEFIETYMNSPDDAEYDPPAVIAQELLNELRALRRVLAANTSPTEIPGTSDDNLVILRLPSERSFPVLVPKRASQQYVPPNKPTEQEPKTVLRNFSISRELWRDFQIKVKSEDATSASKRLVVFIKEYIGQYDVTHKKQTMAIAKDIEVALRQLQDLVRANTTKVSGVDLKGKSVALIKTPFPGLDSSVKTGRKKTIPKNTPISRPVENQQN